MKGSVNNGEAGDLKRHRAHYDVTVMAKLFLLQFDNFVLTLQGYFSGTEVSMRSRKRVTISFEECGYVNAWSWSHEYPQMTSKKRTLQMCNDVRQDSIYDHF